MLSIEEVGPELPRVARTAIASLLKDGVAPPPSQLDAPSAGVFVTLRNPDGSLRGCIGSISPTEHDIVAETMRSARLAATRDPRFPAVDLGELERLLIEVSVLEPEEPARDVSELDPRRYGVIVRDKAGRRGLLLPDIEGIDDAATQIAIARQKAGIPPGTPCELWRFRVKKFKD